MGKAQRKAARGRSASDDADGFVGFIQDVELLEKFINSEVNMGDLSALDAAKESGPKKGKRQGRKKSSTSKAADSKGNAGNVAKEIINESENESFEECSGPSTGDFTGDQQKNNKKKSASKKKKKQNDEEKEVMAVPTEEIGAANNRWANLETEKASPKKKKKTKKNKKASSSRSESADWFDAVEKLGDDEVSTGTDQSDNASELPDDDDGWSTVCQKKKAPKEKAMKPLVSPFSNQSPVKPFTKSMMMAPPKFPRKQPFSPFQSKVVGGVFQKNPSKLTMGSLLATSTGSSSSRNSFSSASSSSVATTTSKCSEVTAKGDLPTEKVDAAGDGDSDGKLVGTSSAEVLDNSDPFPPLPLYFSKPPEVSGKEEEDGSKLLDSGDCWLKLPKPASPLPQAQDQAQVTPISAKSITAGIASAASADQLPNSHSTQPGLCELKEPSPSGYQQLEVCQAEVGPFQENQWPSVVDSGTAIFIDDSNGNNSSNNSFSSSFSPSSTDANFSEVVNSMPSSEPYQSDLPIEDFNNDSAELLESTFARVLDTIDHLRETCKGKAPDNGQQPKSFAFNFDPPAESSSSISGEIHDQSIVPSFGFFEDSQLVSLVLGKADSLNEAEPVVFATRSSSSSQKSAVSSVDAQLKKEKKEVQQEVKEEKKAPPSISGAIVKISITTFDNPTSTVFVSCVDQLKDCRFVDKVNSGSYNYQDVVEYVSKTWSDVKSVITSLADV